MAETNFFAQFDAPSPAGGESGGGPLVVTVAPRRQPQAEAASFPAPSGNYFEQFDQAPQGEMSASNVGRSVARGVPIIGGLLNKANAATNAALDPLIPDAVVNAFGGKRIPGETFGERYENELKNQNETDEEFKRQHPVVATGGELVGGVAGMIPMVMAAPAAFGVGAGPIALRAGASGVTGAAIGGADSAIRSGDLNEAKTGALAGGVLGFASPYIGAGIGRLAELGRNAIGWRGGATQPAQIGGQAADMLAQDFTSAGGPQAVRGRLATLGQDAMLLDASPGLQGRAQGLATQPETRDAIMAPLQARNAGTNTRLRADVDANLGPAPIPSHVEAGLDKNRQIVGDLYEPLFRNAQPIRASRLAETLDRMAENLRGDTRRAVVNARRMLDVPGRTGVLDTNPRALFNVRQELDGLMGVEKNDKVLAQLGFVRQAVDDYLRAALPGNRAAGVMGIKDVDAQFHELMRQSEGLRRGAQVLDTGKSAVRPAEMAEEVAAKTIPQGEMIGPSGETFQMRQGLRGDIDRKLGTKSNDLEALRKELLSEGDWNQPKIGVLFGEDRAANVAGAVDRERAFRDSFNKIVENSQTDMRAAARKGVEPRPAGEGSGSLNDVGTGIAAVAGGAPAAALNLGVRGVRLSANQVARAAELARNGELAKVLTQKSGPELDLLIKTIENRIGLQAAGQNARDKAAYLAQVLTQAQGSRGSRNLPESWRR